MAAVAIEGPRQLQFARPRFIRGSLGDRPWRRGLCIDFVCALEGIRRVMPLLSGADGMLAFERRKQLS